MRPNASAATNLVDITPFLQRMRAADQDAIDEENARADKIEALLCATAKLMRLLKVAKANGRPHMLIEKVLRAQLNIVRELDELRRQSSP